MVPLNENGVLHSLAKVPFSAQLSLTIRIAGGIVIAACTKVGNHGGKWRHVCGESCQERQVRSTILIPTKKSAPCRREEPVA